MTTMTAQLTFGQCGLLIPAARPLVPVEVLMTLGDLHEDDALELVQSGQIAWAWDIRAPSAERREIRIWRESLLGWLSDRTGAGQPECAISALFPHSLAEIKSTELQRMFCCSQYHVYTLIAGGCITAITAGRRAPGGYARVTRDSIENFLTYRRIT